MRTRALSLLLAAAAVLSLAGCVTPRAVPERISDAELQQYLERRLDAAWLNTGLDGSVQRPEVDRDMLADHYRDGNNVQHLTECLSEGGITSWGSGERNGGPTVLADNGSPADQAIQLIWYRCFAEHPTDAMYLGVRLSRAESEYLYDYYQEWVIPCLTLEGYSVISVPTREEYLGEFSFGWVPYYNLAPGLAGIDPYATGTDPGFFIELADRCGNPFPGMPYGERYGF